MKHGGLWAVVSLCLAACGQPTTETVREIVREVPASVPADEEKTAAETGEGRWSLNTDEATKYFVTEAV
jgi:hypothetical protein